MKGFEKYLNTEKENSILTRRELWSESQIEEAGRIWKAALKWALENGYVDEYGDDLINAQDIEKELKE